mmetsp:Transcript_75109/g.178527  ORF Transcript_75109/g.178527 Transcript_75109/m.178527 type:complete len:289 (-) Transcript_75109:330-1196(-)
MINGIKLAIHSLIEKGVRKPRDPPANAITGGMASGNKPAAQHSVPSPPRHTSRSMRRSSSSTFGVQVLKRDTNPNGNPSLFPQPHFRTGSDVCLSSLSQSQCGVSQPHDPSELLEFLRGLSGHSISAKRSGSMTIVTFCESSQDAISRNASVTCLSPCLATSITVLGLSVQLIKVFCLVVGSILNPAVITWLSTGTLPKEGSWAACLVGLLQALRDGLWRKLRCSEPGVCSGSREASACISSLSLQTLQGTALMSVNCGSNGFFSGKKPASSSSLPTLATRDVLARLW